MVQGDGAKGGRSYNLEQDIIVKHMIFYNDKGRK